MVVFLVSSQENKTVLEEISILIEGLDHQVLRWDDNDCFIAGESTISSLMKKRKEVDAAIILYSSDDKVWFRNDKITQPRDNVLFEHGLFIGALGIERTIIIRTDNNVKIPTDLHGLTYISYEQRKLSTIKRKIQIWLDKLQKANTETVHINWNIDYKNSELNKYLLAYGSLQKSMNQYIDYLYGTKYSIAKLELKQYILLVLTSFVDRFWGQHNARFTIRKYNARSKSMKAYMTTHQDHTPGDIPLSKPNMISNSFRLSRPLIYSENKEFHYNTKNNSIGKEYIDYVSYAFYPNKGNKPLWSLCLDVKRPQDVDILKMLVHSHYFEFVCSFIDFRLNKQDEIKN